jgi:hypothetical protein
VHEIVSKDMGANMTITAEMLMPYVERGASRQCMSLQLKASKRGVWVALHRYGLYQRWREKRNKLSAVALLPLVQSGASAIDMASHLKVARCTLRRALHEYGLHKIWAQHRFKKCAVGAT